METNYYCVRTKPRREAVAAASLQSYGIRVVSPRIEEVHKTCHRDNLVIVPMFRGYVFAKLNLEHFYSLGRVHGVQSLVSFDGPPPSVDAAFIDELRSRMDGLGVIRLGRPAEVKPAGFSPGEPVKIDGGPFSGYFGVFKGGLDSEGRVKVLLDSLYQSTIQPVVHVHHALVSSMAAH